MALVIVENSALAVALDPGSGNYIIKILDKDEGRTYAFATNRAGLEILNKELSKLLGGLTVAGPNDIPRTGPSPGPAA